MSRARVYPPPTSGEFLEPMSSLMPHPHWSMARGNRGYYYPLPPQTHTCRYEEMSSSPDLNHVVCLFLRWFNRSLHASSINELNDPFSKESFLAMSSQGAAPRSCMGLFKVKAVFSPGCNMNLLRRWMVTLCLLAFH